MVVGVVWAIIAVDRALDLEVVPGFIKETLVLILDVLDSQVQIVYLCHHALLLFTSHLDLLNKVLSSSSLIFRLLNPSESMIGLNDFAFTLRDHRLELLPLPDHLLFLGIKLLSELNVLLQKCIPFTSALLLLAFKFLHEASHANHLLGLSFQ